MNFTILLYYYTHIISNRDFYDAPNNGNNTIICDNDDNH